jgi:hypothetical protein
MGLIDWIVIAVLALIIGGAAAYIIKAKKSGQKCIGCPYSGECAAKGKSCCSDSCHCDDQKE